MTSNQATLHSNQLYLSESDSINYITAAKEMIYFMTSKTIFAVSLGAFIHERIVRTCVGYPIAFYEYWASSMRLLFNLLVTQRNPMELHIQSYDSPTDDWDTVIIQVPCRWELIKIPCHKWNTVHWISKIICRLVMNSKIIELNCFGANLISYLKSNQQMSSMSQKCQ